MGKIEILIKSLQVAVYRNKKKLEIKIKERTI